MGYERLTVVDKDGNIDIVGIWDVDMRREDERKYHAAINRLAELEDKIENGTLVELPCKVGDMVYGVGALRRVVNGCVKSIQITEFTTKYTLEENGFAYWIDEVFLTKAEAEEKLRELRGEKD